VSKLKAFQLFGAFLKEKLKDVGREEDKSTPID
jgi:hypothetical protein